MKRRLFLESAAMAGGAAALGLPGRVRAARAAGPAPLERAGLAPAARLSRFGGAGALAAEVVDLPLASGSTARRQLGDATWSCALRATPVKGAGARPGRPPAVDLVATFKLERGAAPEAAVGLALTFSRWSRSDYVLLPGACYAGNRFESRHIAYPPRLAEAADIGPNVPVIVSDIPRLNVRAGSSRLQVLAADLATPAVGVHAPATGTGVLVLVEPATRLGLSCLTLEESDDRTHARLVLGAPGVREGVAYAAGNTRLPSKDRGAAFRAGDTLVLRLRVHVFDCPDVQGLFDALAVVRKDLTGPTARPAELPFSAAWKAHEARVNRRFVEASGIFSADARQGATAWQSGWCGGLATTLPLLAFGEPPSRERARRTLGFLFSSAQAPSGFFRSVFDGARWLDDGPPAPSPSSPSADTARRAPSTRHLGRWHLVRRSADALTFAGKQLLVMQRQDPASKPDARWLAGLGRCADAFVRLWDREKQLGQFVDVETGELIVGGSTSAGLAPAGLALAAALLKRDDCLATAHAAAEQLFERYVRVGLTCGGPGDALQCPDGESAIALCESFVTLFEQTGERVWLDRATATARQVASWVISYDAAEPSRGSAVRATGAVLSNAQNGRGAPGYTLLSGDALFRLYRATGDTTHLELLRDTVHNLAQYLPRADQADHGEPGAGAPAADTLGAGTPAAGTSAAGAPAAGAPGSGAPAAGAPGAGAPAAGERQARRARSETRDWLERAPDVVPATSVFDTACLLAYSEVPGVYVRTDSGFVFVFDHVEARVRERAPGRLVVTIKNPTQIDAAVRVLGESDAEAARPLGPGALLAAHVVAVPAGAAVDVDFDAPVATAR
jgi:hypothetical protein